MGALANYPTHWEADVLLSDGGAARLRPSRSDDVDRVLDFYERVSDESRYMRFLAPRPALTERDVQRFTGVDQSDNVVFVITVGDDIIGIGGYDRLNDAEAEVSFLVVDDYQGRGVGALLLEHLSEAGREKGIHRIVGEVLPENGKMIMSFRAAGYQMAVGFVQGLMRFQFSVEPTETSIDVMRSREHRAEARSMERFFKVKSIAVVGASPKRNSIGWNAVHNLVHGGYTGRVYAVNLYADAILGLPAYRSMRDIPTDVDLAIIAVPADSVCDVVLDCATKKVHGLIVLSRGFADAGGHGRERQRELLEVTRANGMRIVGPNALGVINTAPEYSMNAALSPVMPPSGRVGLFCQSGALGVAILRDAADRGLGISTFVSAGNRADVSGNDLLQYWEEDPETEVILLYLESIGNLRKFSRLARRVGKVKPVVALKSGRTTHVVPQGHSVRPIMAPQNAVNSMFRQAGIIQVDTIDELFDVAQLLAHQPLPTGPHVAVIANSDALLLLTLDATSALGLKVERTTLLRDDATADDFDSALHTAIEDSDIHAIIAVFTPRLDGSGDDVAEVLAEAGKRCEKTLVSTFLAFSGIPASLRVGRGPGRSAERGSVPSYQAPEAAARALARVVTYAEWSHREVGTVPTLPDIDPDAARALVDEVLAAHPDGHDLDGDTARRLLGYYGVSVLPVRYVRTVEEASAAGAELGWNVILKATAASVRGRLFLGHERRNLRGPQEMADAWTFLHDTLHDTLPDLDSAPFAVQSMAPPGLPMTVRSMEDPSFGPILSFGVAGPGSDLLQDVAYRVPPLTELDAADMVREVRAAPMFFGFHGGPPLCMDAVQDLLHRIGQLQDALREVAYVDLGLIVGVERLAIHEVSVRVAHPVAFRPDGNTRRLSTPVHGPVQGSDGAPGPAAGIPAVVPVSAPDE